MKKALIIFAKEPVPGTVKTRLQKDLGPKKTVKIYKAFLNEILSNCSRLRGVDKFLGCAPSNEEAYLSKLASKYKMNSFSQHGKNLHDRMFNGLRHCADMGYSEIALIGSDLPSLPVEHIKMAFSALRKNDFVIGPSFDQGLYLIGARKDKIDIIAHSFTSDTGKDVSLVLRKINRREISLFMLPFWYDVDDINDLDFLKSHLKYLNRKLSL